MYVSYPALFYKNIDSDGYYVVFPDLDGAGTFGDSQADALYMAQDYLGAILYDYYVEKKEYPKASSIKDVSLDPNEEYAIIDESFISLVGLDMNQYVKQVDKKTVKKTLTIPSYLNEMGKNMGVNFSQLLTEALESEFDIE